MRMNSRDLIRLVCFGCHLILFFLYLIHWTRANRSDFRFEHRFVSKNTFEIRNQQNFKIFAVLVPTIEVILVVLDATASQLLNVM